MKILVATDGSRHALRAVKYAARLVRLMWSASSGITLISVHDDAGLRHAKAFVGSAEVADYLRELSEKDLKPAQRVLEAVEIVACASAGKFDLIVVGSKGRGAIADLLLGSVAQRVLAMAQQPVLLVK